MSPDLTMNRISKEENIFLSRLSRLSSPFLPFLHLFSTSLSYVVNFYKLIRHLQWGTHLSLVGEKRVKNKLMTILLMRWGGGMTRKVNFFLKVLYPPTTYGVARNTYIHIAIQRTRRKSRRLQVPYNFGVPDISGPYFCSTKESCRGQGFPERL